MLALDLLQADDVGAAVRQELRDARGIERAAFVGIDFAEKRLGRGKIDLGRIGIIAGVVTQAGGRIVSGYDDPGIDDLRIELPAVNE